MTITWLWTVTAAIGLGFSWWNIRDAGKDMAALSTVQRNGPARMAARFLQTTEILRGLQFVTALAIGVAALLAPHLSGGWQRVIGESLGWVLLLHLVLLMANSGQSTLYRRAIRQKEEP